MIRAARPVPEQEGDGNGSMLSVVIPIHNEEGNVVALCRNLSTVLDRLQRPYEVLFVDDGSTDESGTRLAELAHAEDRIKVITFRRNCGQTAAMMAGIAHARGDVIIPMDGDGQNDPADIPRLLSKLSEGYDVVSGWRRRRKDKQRSRVVMSRIANMLISRVAGVPLHDYGCSLKAYRRETIKPVRLYGEMHRFIPIYASWQGARVTEVAVNHHPRREGTSKYGVERVVKVLLDLIVVKFLSRYETKPIYVFGGFGFLCLLIAFLAGAYALYLKFVEGVSFILTPLPLAAVMSFITGIMSILMGLLAEILVRTYFESQAKTPYTIKKTLNLDGDG